MLNWARKFFQSILSKFEAENTALEMEEWDETPIPQSPHSSDNSAPSSEARKPILVRGKFWVDTSEDRWELPQELEESVDLGVEGLVKRLARVDKAEARRTAAENLGQLGEDAIPVIPALMIAAIDIDPSVRNAALNALNEIDPAWPQNEAARTAFPDLIAALKNWSSEVVGAATRLLNLIGLPAVPDFADALLNGQDTPEKIHVIQVLARLGPGAVSAVPGLTRSLGSQTLQVRIAAARALANIGTLAETAVPSLIVGLTDPFSGGRRAMAVCLANMGPVAEPATPALLPLLSDRDKSVRKAAAAALVQIGPQTVPALIKIIQSPDTQQLKKQIDAMIKSSRWFILSKNNRFLQENLIVVRYSKWAAYFTVEELESLHAAHETAIKILGEFGPEAATAVDTVAPMLNVPNLQIKLAAAQTLGQIGPHAKSTIADLIQMLTDNDKSIRARVAQALTNIDPDWASHFSVADIVSELAGQLSKTGNAAGAAIHTSVLIGSAAVPALIDTLATGNRIAQENAATALGQIGPGAESAVPALQKAIQDSHLWVQEKATKALEKINGPIS